MDMDTFDYAFDIIDSIRENFRAELTELNIQEKGKISITLKVHPERDPNFKKDEG